MNYLKRVVLSHFFLLTASLLCCFPIYRMIYLSLQPSDSLLSSQLHFWPQNLSLDHYRLVYLQTGFWHWLFNSLVITLLSSILAVALSAPAAYALSRYSIRGKGIIFSFLLGSQMIPPVMLLLPLYFMLARFRLIDQFLGAILIYLMMTLPFCIWLLKGFFDKVPKSVEWAAQLDGLSEYQSFVRIVLPVAAPSLAIALLFAMTQVWNEYIVARVVLQDSDLYTWPLGLFELQGEFDTQWGLFAAASTTVTIPITIVFIYLSRWLLTGLTVGSGVKG